MEEGTRFCSDCGAPLQNFNNYVGTNTNQPRKAGLGIVALIPGIVGILAWIIPIIGLPVAIVVDSANGVKKAAVEITFDDESAKTFADITTNNAGKSIGMYLNDDMIANPRIVSAITGGKCQVEVNTYEEAQLLSESLEKCK